MILPLDRDPIILTSTSYYTHIARKTFWIRDVRTVEIDDYGKETRKIVQDLSIVDGIGTVGFDDVPLKIWKSLEKAFPNQQFTSGDDIFEEAKSIKSAREIELMEEAAHLSDIMFKTLTKTAREGKYEYAIRADMEHHARIEGAELAEVWLSCGQPAYNPCGYSVYENWRRLQHGDQILAGTLVVRQGYWAHALRTGLLGEPSESERGAHEVVLEDQTTALRLVKPGALVGDVNEAAMTVVRDAGFEVPFRRGWE